MSHQLKNQFILRWIFSGLSVVFFGLAAWLTLFEKNTSASIAATVGVIVFLLANLDQIESIKGLGSAIEPRRPSTVNRTWQARVRNVLQTSGDFMPVRRGRWRIAAGCSARAA